MTSPPYTAEANGYLSIPILFGIFATFDTPDHIPILETHLSLADVSLLSESLS